MENTDQKLIVILDGMGAGIGKGIVERICALNSNAQILAVGTNSAATGNMLRAGITAATGENAWIYNCARASIIIGPIGIIIPNAMHGEISSNMALAVTQSSAAKILIPVSNQHITLAGMPGIPLSQALDSAAVHIRKILEI